jgi:hypothetical protein
MDPAKKGELNKMRKTYPLEANFLLVGSGGCASVKWRMKYEELEGEKDIRSYTPFDNGFWSQVHKGRRRGS